MHAHPPHVYVFVFEACQCKAGILSSWYALQCKGSGYFPKKQQPKKKPNLPVMNVPYLLFFFLLNKAFISVRAVAIVVS